MEWDPSLEEPAHQSMISVGKVEENDAVTMVMDIEYLFFGSFLFLGVVFFLGLVVNLPAAVIYCRSRQIRGFTDKFILFVLIVDLLSLFIFIPISFLFVLEYSASVSGSVVGGPQGGEFPLPRPFFVDELQKDEEQHGKSFASSNKKSGESTDFFEDGEFSSFCVQQWIFLIHKLIFIMAANLSVLGALKIAVERYLAVVAPLHYHKILKSSVIFFVALFSFILSLASAVITAVDPADFSGSFLIGGQCNLKFFHGQSPSSSSWSPTTLSKKQATSSLSMRFDSSSSEEDLDESAISGLKLDKGDDEMEDPSILESLPYQSIHHFPPPDISSASPVGFWWWPVLKLVHAAVFFLVPVIVMLFMYLRIRTEARRQNHRMSYRTKSSFILPAAVAGGEAVVGGDVKKSVSFSVDGLHQVFGKFKLVQRLRRKTRMDRAARVAVLTIGLSVLCFGPLFFVQILSAVTTLTKSHLSINPWGNSVPSFLPHAPLNSSSQFAKFLLPTLLACLHPLLSPLVYVYRYKRVRSELKALVRKMISRCCCCFCFCCNSHSSTSSSSASSDCQEVIRQFNQLAQQKLSPLSSPPASPLESQTTTLSDCSNGDETTGIKTIDVKSNILYYDDDMEDEDEDIMPKHIDSDYLFYPHLQQHHHHPSQEDYDDDDLVGAGEFSDMENGRVEGEHDLHLEQHVISMGRPSSSNSNGSGGGGGAGLFHILNSWMSSYSRRWNQHRESVTSTASFITLLSNRSRSIPSSASSPSAVDII